MEIALMLQAGTHEDALTAVAYAPLQRVIYTAAEGDRGIKAWDARSGTRLRTSVGHRGGVTSLVYVPCHKLLFSGSIDGFIAVWTDKGVLLQVWDTCMDARAHTCMHTLVLLTATLSWPVCAA